MIIISIRREKYFCNSIFFPFKKNDRSESEMSNYPSSIDHAHQAIVERIQTVLTRYNASLKEWQLDLNVCLKSEPNEINEAKFTSETNLSAQTITANKQNDQTINDLLECLVSSRYSHLLKVNYSIL